MKCYLQAAGIQKVENVDCTVTSVYLLQEINQKMEQLDEGKKNSESTDVLPLVEQAGNVLHSLEETMALSAERFVETLQHKYEMIRKRKHRPKSYLLQ